MTDRNGGALPAGKVGRSGGGKVTHPKIVQKPVKTRKKPSIENTKNTETINKMGVVGQIPASRDSIFVKINNWKGLFPSFKSTNKVFAFILNALAIGISATIGLVIHDKLTDAEIPFFKKHEWVKYIVVGFGSLLAAFITYMILLILFGFGGGMLVNSGC